MLVFFVCCSFHFSPARFFARLFSFSQFHCGTLFVNIFAFFFLRLSTDLIWFDLMSDRWVACFDCVSATIECYASANWSHACQLHHNHVAFDKIQLSFVIFFIFSVISFLIVLFLVYFSWFRFVFVALFCLCHSVFACMCRLFIFRQFSLSSFWYFFPLLHISFVLFPFDEIESK